MQLIRETVPTRMPEEEFDFRNASQVTIIVRQGDEGSDDESIEYEDNASTEAATGNQAVAGASEPALTKFLVHESLVCEASPVLKAAFQGNFAEAGSKTMTIKDLDADMVNQFLKWLYRGKGFRVKPDTEEQEQLYFLNMARLVVVADVWRVEGLEDDVIDQLVKCVNPAIKPPQWLVIDFAYANTCNLSYLRRFVVAWYTERVDMGFYKRGDARTELAKRPELVNDIAMAFGKQLTHPKPKSFFEMTREERKAPVDL